MIKRVTALFFLLLANILLLGHSIIIHHHHHHDSLSAEHVLHKEHDKENSHHYLHDNSGEEHDVLEHCHLLTNNEFYSTYISPSKFSKQLKRSVKFSLIGTGGLVLNKNLVIKKVNLDFPFLITSSFKQGVTALRGPPVV